MVDQNIADKDLCPCGSNKGELRPDGTEKVTEFRFTGNHMGAREPKGAAREPKGAAREPKGAAREPKGAAREPKGAAREPKGAAREPKSAACCHGKPDSSHINPAPTRRSMLFSGFTLGLAALGSVFGLWGAATLRFFFPNIITEPPNRFRVGFPTDYAPGQVETRFKEQYGVWVVNGTYNGKQQIYALSTVCTHLGCITLWLDNEQKFKCPCHGSGFYRDGINYEGPAPRPLERYAIRIAEDGQLEVDKSKRFQEELGQWNDPSCFVQV